MRVPDYLTTEECRVLTMEDNVIGDPIVIPANTFVKPIKVCYVPKHVLERSLHKYFNPEKEIYCYTPYGMHALPLKSLRQV